MMAWQARGRSDLHAIVVTVAVCRRFSLFPLGIHSGGSNTSAVPRHGMLSRG